MFTVEANGDLARVTVYDARGNQLRRFMGPRATLPAMIERLILQGYGKVTKSDVAKCR